MRFTPLTPSSLGEERRKRLVIDYELIDDEPISGDPRSNWGTGARREEGKRGRVYLVGACGKRALRALSRIIARSSRVYFSSVLLSASTAARLITTLYPLTEVPAQTRERRSRAETGYRRRY